jgi:HEAT repeat protein
MGLKKRDTTSLPAAPDYAQDLPGLLVQLHSTDVVMRHWAARDLAHYPQAVPVLCQCLQQDADPAMREAISLSLIAIGGSVVIEQLLPLLHAEDMALRECVAGILKELPADMAPCIDALLNNEDPEKRIAVIVMLESLHTPSVEQWLLTLIVKEQHVNVIAAALDVLGEVGTDAALEVLAQVAARFPDEPFVNFAVESAVRRIKGATVHEWYHH